MAIDKLTSAAAKAMQAARKRKVGGFSDPKVRAIAMEKSLETRRINAQKQKETEDLR